MKAILLLGPLKKEGVSNTETLTSFFYSHLEEEGIEAEVIKLVDYKLFIKLESERKYGSDSSLFSLVLFILRLSVFRQIYFCNSTNDGL